MTWTWIARAVVAAVYLAMAGIAAASCVGHGETELQGAKYAVDLEDCNRESKTLCASVVCENHVRARAGRLPRGLPPSCVDGGAP